MWGYSGWVAGKCTMNVGEEVASVVPAAATFGSAKAATTAPWLCHALWNYWFFEVVYEFYESNALHMFSLCCEMLTFHIIESLEEVTAQ